MELAPDADAESRRDAAATPSDSAEQDTITVKTLEPPAVAEKEEQKQEQEQEQPQPGRKRGRPPKRAADQPVQIAPAKTAPGKRGRPRKAAPDATPAAHERPAKRSKTTVDEADTSTTPALTAPAPARQQALHSLANGEAAADDDAISTILAALPRDSTARRITLPVPALAFDFRLCCQLHPRVSVGRGPFGQRNWISFRGGHWAATWGRGTIVPGGQDNQVVTDDGSVAIDTAYLLETAEDDGQPPAHITVKTSGWRTGPKEVLTRLTDPALADDVRPSEYSFRLHVSLETGDARYSFVNSAMWLASAARRGAEVIYDAYRIR